MFGRKDGIIRRDDEKRSSAFVRLRTCRCSGHSRRVFTSFLGNPLLGLPFLLVDFLHRFAGQFLPKQAFNDVSLPRSAIPNHDEDTATNVTGNGATEDDGG